MWINRDLSSFFDLKAGLPVQVVWGPRQCGKSALLKKVSENWNFSTLDDLTNRKMAQSDPALFLQQNPPPVVIDEVQYAPNLFPQIKMVVDELRTKERLKKPIFRMTGSHQILLDQRIKESLGGRAHFLRLHGFSLSEADSLVNSIEEFIFRGS